MFYQSDRFEVRVHRVSATRTQWVLDRNGKSYEALIKDRRTTRALCILGKEARQFLVGLKAAEDKDAACSAKLRAG